MIKVNLTISLEDEERDKFRNWLEQYIEVIDFRTLPNTEGWYHTKPAFKKLVDNVKKAQRERDNYIFR